MRNIDYPKYDSYYDNDCYDIFKIKNFKIRFINIWK